MREKTAGTCVLATVACILKTARVRGGFAFLPAPASQPRQFTCSIASTIVSAAREVLTACKCSWCSSMRKSRGVWPPRARAHQTAAVSPGGVRACASHFTSTPSQPTSTRLVHVKVTKRSSVLQWARRERLLGRAWRARRNADRVDPAFVFLLFATDASHTLRSNVALQLYIHSLLS